MIEFKIISTPDRTQQATYQHMSPEISFGREEGDMLIDDPMFAPLQFKVRLEGNRAILENLASGVEMRLNGKPIDSECPIKERDNLTVGRTTIHFSRLDLQPPQPPEPYEHPRAALRFADGTKESAILEVLSILERSSNPSGGGVPHMPPPVAGMPPIPGSVKPPLPKKS